MYKNFITSFNRCCYYFNVQWNADDFEGKDTIHSMQGDTVHVSRGPVAA